MTLLTQTVSDDVLDSAYEWLCLRRKNWPADCDVWSLRFCWSTEKARLRDELLAGRYHFEPLSRVTKSDGTVIHIWSARDALVLKALAIVLGKHLPAHNFVMRTDVKAYYESIDQHLLLEILATHIKDRGVLNLLWQVMRRTVTWGGLYWDCKQGISRGCPLSPLLGAVFLNALDAAMEALGLLYVRFMDDMLVLAPTRWKLKKAVKRLNEIFNASKLEKHPDKTFIGRIEKGFDFLGYHFSRDGLTVAMDTLDRFVERAARLFEQERGKPEGFPLLGLYVRQWIGWAGVYSTTVSWSVILPLKSAGPNTDAEPLHS